MMKYPIYAFLLVFKYCYAAMPIYQNEETEVQQCVVKIIERIELAEAANVALVNVNASLAKDLHSLLERHVRFVSRSFDWLGDTLLYDVYFIQCTNITMLLRGLDLMKQDPFWNPRAKFVMIIENTENFLHNMSNYLINHHVNNVALVVSGMIYTFGLRRDECDRPVPKRLQFLSRCSQVQNLDKIYVAARRISLRGFRVKFVSHQLNPFTYFGTFEAPGVEQYILKLIAEYDNITIEVKKIKGSYEFGVRLNNFTFTGMLHEIETGKVEGAMGGYFINLDRATNFDFVYPYMVDKFVIVTAPAKFLGNWSAVLKQLGAPTICGIFATFCVLCVIVICMKIFQDGVKDTSRDILILWGYFLNNITQIKDAKIGTPYRLVLMTTLLFVLIISCSTQAFLFSATTNPIREYQPDTVQEVISQYHLVESPHSQQYLQTDPSLNISNAAYSCEVTSSCVVKVLTKTEPLYTIASYLFIKHYHSKFIFNNFSTIRTLPEPIAIIQQTMYVRKGSPLVVPFNRLLLRARSAGLIDKYLNKLLFENWLRYEYHTVPVKKPQSLETLKEVYVILIIGYSISTIVFVIELSHKQ